jgi:hypothetical protein
MVVREGATKKVSEQRQLQQAHRRVTVMFPKKGKGL